VETACSEWQLYRIMVFRVNIKLILSRLFRILMPTDTNENSSLSTSMTTVTDNNNNNGSSSTPITTQTSPLSSSSSSSPPSHQTTAVRSNSSIQLDKLRRFLSTLYYFGSDISNDIGERVRALVLALVVRFSNGIPIKYIWFFLVRIMLCPSKNFTENFKRQQIFHYDRLHYHF
jgi:hypothetical protein